MTELLLAGLEEGLFSECETESLEAFVVETDLTLELLLGATDTVAD